MAIPFDDTRHALRPIIKMWTKLLDRAHEQKKPFQEVADECMQFFCASAGWMWDKKNKNKFWTGTVAPRFRMTVAKAFELVALFAPVLAHRNPVRTVTPRRPLELDPLIFQQLAQQMGLPPPMADGPVDPVTGMPMDPAMMLFQQAGQMEQMQAAVDKSRAELLSRILNFTPNEMPGDGLQQHNEDAVTEALVKGMGVTWTELWTPPGGGQPLIVQTQDTCDYLLVDPDAEKWEDAWWIARKCIHPIWQVEDEYPAVRGLLEGKGNLESAASQADTNEMKDIHRRMGKTNDILVYWKIWSKMGIGERLSGVKTDLKDALREVCGDYCYIVIARDIPFPLNLPTEMLSTSTDDEIAQAVSWPVPYWKDNRWPCSLLSFYKEPRQIWPIAPLKPGLGELKFINTMISHLANRIWTSSRDFWAVLKSASENLRKTLEDGGDQSFIEIEGVHQSIDNVVKILQQPQTNMDVWQILQAVMELFDKRVGLTELLYGLNPGRTQPRSAAEMQVKQASISVRPDYMAQKVEQWMTEQARREGITSRLLLRGQHVANILGQMGAMLWDLHVATDDPELAVREFEYRIEAGSARKPDKNRMVANVTDAMPMFVPVLQGYAQMTGNTQPLNDLIAKWGRAVDEDVSGMLLPPMPPPMPVEGNPPPGEGGSPPRGGPSSNGKSKPKNRVSA